MGRKGCQLEDALIFYQYSPRDVIVARLFLQTPAPYVANIKALLVYLHPALAAPPLPRGTAQVGAGVIHQCPVWETSGKSTALVSNVPESPSLHRTGK